MSTALMSPATKPNVNELIAKVGDHSVSFGNRVDSVGKVMYALKDKMLSALPKHITADRMIRVALNCIRKNPKLLDCTPQSLFGAMTEAATYGWELGGVLGHAYLVPYGNECTLIPGYKGLVDLCRRSGQISTIALEVVHEGDQFSYSLGDDPRIEHIPDDRNPKRDSKPITYAYAVVVLRDGGVQRSVWSREKIDAHKQQYSQAWKRADKGKKDSPWHTAWPTMAKKTVIRDMIQRGLVPLSAEYRDVVDRATKYDADEDEGIDALDLIPPTALEDHSAPESDATDRPEDNASTDANLIEEATAAAAAITAELSIQVFLDEYLPKCGGDDERSIIQGLAADAKQRIIDAREARKAKK